MAQSKTRGHTSITEKALPGKASKPNTKTQQFQDVSRGQTPGGGGKHRGDRRDMHPTYTGNERHAARGNTPRKNVATRKD
ncbi:MAG: hypothetical protein ACAI43_09820 [Phycisphaerae bacterium]|nr:hypothetical protein [Tepidisphaeraceae bacterium]